MLIALDTECTGLDLFHGCRPFFVTVCREDKEQLWWEWRVNALTREPSIPPGDVAEIQAVVDEADQIVGQHIKFDAHALTQIGIRWPWEKCLDTLVAGHVLASNHAHDLTSMALEWLGVDIKPFEERLDRAAKEARAIARKRFPAWRIARHGLPEMPSAKKSGGKGKHQRGTERETNSAADWWLPRTLASKLGYPKPQDGCRHRWDGWTCQRCGGHSWWTVLRDYSNCDSGTTLELWQWMEAELKERGHWKLFREQMRLPAIAWEMERRGVTARRSFLTSTRETCQRESAAAGERMLRIAAGFREPCPACEGSGSGEPSLFGSACDRCQGKGQVPVELTLPRGAVNKSLQRFCWDVLRLPKVKHPKSGADTLDSKNALPLYLRELPPGPARDFVAALAVKREYDTALGFVTAYERFGLSTDDPDVLVLHPSLNTCGTDTLRLSSSNPNGQQVSKRKRVNLRKCFGPAPGREWWSLDAENIELRIPAYKSGQKELIDLFERADQPPFYGSEHLLNFSVVFDDLWAEAVRKVGIDRAGPWVKEHLPEYRDCKNGGFCVPMSTQALTRNGWKSFAELEVNDEVAGYDYKCLRWTPIRSKILVNSAKMLRIENDNFSAEATAEHRWLVYRPLAIGRSRGIIKKFVTTADLNTNDSLILSARLIDDGKLPITPDEAAVIGWVYTDGGIESSKYTGATSQSFGKKVKFRLRIWQSKPRGIDIIDNLLAKIGRPFKRLVKANGLVGWELDPDWGRDLWDRAGLNRENEKFDQDFEQLVIDMGSACRREFLGALFEAEGWYDRRGHRMYAQNRGKFSEAMKLAIFLEGNFVSECESSTNYPTDKTCLCIRARMDHVTGQRLRKTLVGTCQAWCVTTDLQSWVMRQGNSIMLTGNSIQYNSVNKADGTGTADRAFKRPGSQTRLEKRFAGKAELNRQKVAEARRTGKIEVERDPTVDPDHGYPILVGKSKWGDASPTQPLAYYVSGTACWWMRRAMVRVAALLKRWEREDPRGWRMVLSVHDELVFDFPAGTGSEPWRTNLDRIKEIKRTMERGGRDIGVPTPVAVTYHAVSWGDGQAIKC